MSQPIGLYGWIRSNDGRSTGLFVGFLAAVQVIAAMALFLPLVLFDAQHAPFFDWGGYALRYAPVVLAASIIWFLWQLFWHIESVKRAVGFHFVDGSDEPRLCRVIEPLIVMTGLPIPFVGVIESDARNAFACGIARKKAVVVVTRGLLDSLDDEELACVLGHELSHIKNGDIRLMAAANIFLTALNKLHQNNPLRFTPIHLVLAIAIPAILPISLAGGFLGHIALRAGQVLRLLIASSREFIADAEAVQLTKNPAAMASALVKVEHSFRIGSARQEDDAMMIAGDTEGQDATHPTVAQRVAALARVTGSMVFNAPGALRPEIWDESKSLSEARTAALLRKLPETRALPRVRAGTRVNFLGLTRLGTAMVAAAAAALLWIHADELHRPELIKAKFDLRPLSIILGNPLACTAAGGQLAACAAAPAASAYKDFEGQKNTLAGFLAEESRRRRDAGYANPDLTLGNLDPQARRLPYRGQSGQLEGVLAVQSSGGTYAIAGSPGSYSSAPAETLEIAEVDGVGCFPATMLHGKADGKFPLGEDGSGNDALERYSGSAFGSVIPNAEPGTAQRDAWLRSYVTQRETLLRASYDLWGREGLAAMLAIYQGSAHRKVLEELRARSADPALTRGMKPLDAAKLRSLARDPAKFIPCIAVRHAAKAAAGS